MRQNAHALFPLFLMKTKYNIFFLIVFLVACAGTIFVIVKNRAQVSSQISTAVENVIDGAKSFATSTVSLSNAVKKTFLAPGGLVAKIESDSAVLTKSGVFALTNADRSKQGLLALVSNASLDTIALRRAKDMFAKQYFEHVSPSGDSASVEADSIGYEYIVIGENIALGNFENDAALEAAWMASPGHRANILNTRFTSLGVAVEKGMYNGRSTWIAVQIFARPLSLCPKVNESLKTNAQVKIATLATLHSNADALQAEIRSMSPRTQEEVNTYNKLVSDYNALADQINTLNIEVKADIDAYNADVRRYNTCIK